MSRTIYIYIIVYWQLYLSTTCYGTMPSISSALSGVGSLFEYKTSELLHDLNDGFIAAFGDFDGDERVDIFVITNTSQQLDVLLAQENKPYVRKALIQIENNTIITSVVPSDFNGDLQMDLLVTTRPIGQPTARLNAFLCWGNHSAGTLSEQTPILNGTLLAEPLVFDYNADLYPDLLAEMSPGDRRVWLGCANKTFTMIDFPSVEGKNATPFTIPHSHAFVDINADMAADLVLTTADGYEVWMSLDGVFRFNATYPPPEQFQGDGYVGQSSYADLDQDRIMEHIVAGCTDKDCTHSAVYVRYLDQWVPIMKPEDLMYGELLWNFIPPELSIFSKYTNQTFPVTLRMTDYNLDGYPDAIATLRNSSQDGIQQVFVLDNIECVEKLCNNFSRTFKLTSMEDTVKNAMVATFYDIYEDGTPDFVMVTMSHDPVKDTHSPKIILLKNDLAIDSCFIKVTVVSGLCYKECPNANSPLGVNYPGAAVTYNTMKTDGSAQSSAGTQLSQSAHYALQTPYQTFGLGSTPNFIESLIVGLPRRKHGVQREKTWSFIIPNSQLIVITHPADKPSSWMLKLYITPSQLVYLTGAALLGTCGFVAGIVLILQWREKREDKVEKKQESHRFHFDAM